MKIDFSDYVRGAALAADLVNSAPEVRRISGEVLVDAAALGRFLTERGIGPEREPVAEDLVRVLELRRELRAVLEARDEDGVAEAAGELVRRASTGPVLGRDADGRWQWQVETAPRASLADELAVLAGLGLLGALRALGHERFRPCASPVCDGVFVDTSKAGRRRYCTPGLCGNRINVANHRARHRERG
ncbi:Putative stress-induced transcription regulator [Saccharopolyspora antimicrobica]|uniref:Stress-induced transcription regulator n=1 Tax=Saccharopolyspora antimicrobica TaxID=455193 RepID=A0A1I5B8H4_9PSEU|nr:CGNR zinc finger domain-containing protein [Saccharopolyspora antimicrobica]RKT86504.1 putative stress-induced transcription regulator [Saccharopolyspora antimicrobica]SFN71012.1 Putative stress-induced transcription regulator [Saccharopolyspora antimicrobica]